MPLTLWAWPLLPLYSEDVALGAPRSIKMVRLGRQSLLQDLRPLPNLLQQVPPDLEVPNSFGQDLRLRRFGGMRFLLFIFFSTLQNDSIGNESC